ncbi:uncharacterized protein BXZ73DRAFT_77595 [Epithele typhae]|uniref:uncharacterized protein n=1 Tax=Epithele typhae TaxID=378194 RepID=UPI002008E4EF|nr:uncharacterized protein BXZ73DRAFT_77595 [Epithele typhae]KAH9932089.1 hypothetical protein BXZ73DRAFT_77595 [Epithele typhae]
MEWSKNRSSELVSVRRRLDTGADSDCERADISWGVGTLLELGKVLKKVVVAILNLLSAVFTFVIVPVGLVWDSFALLKVILTDRGELATRCWHERQGCVETEAVEGSIISLTGPWVAIGVATRSHGKIDPLYSISALYTAKFCPVPSAAGWQLPVADGEMAERQSSAANTKERGVTRASAAEARRGGVESGREPGWGRDKGNGQRRVRRTRCGGKQAWAPAAARRTAGCGLGRSATGPAPVLQACRPARRCAETLIMKMCIVRGRKAAEVFHEQQARGGRMTPCRWPRPIRQAGHGACPRGIGRGDTRRLLSSASSGVRHRCSFPLRPHSRPPAPSALRSPWRPRLGGESSSFPPPQPHAQSRAIVHFSAAPPPARPVARAARAVADRVRPERADGEPSTSFISARPPPLDVLTGTGTRARCSPAAATRLAARSPPPSQSPSLPAVIVGYVGGSLPSAHPPLRPRRPGTSTRPPAPPPRVSARDSHAPRARVAGDANVLRGASHVVHHASCIVPHRARKPADGVRWPPRGPCGHSPLGRGTGPGAALAGAPSLVKQGSGFDRGVVRVAVHHTVCAVGVWDRVGSSAVAVCPRALGGGGRTACWQETHARSSRRGDQRQPGVSTTRRRSPDATTESQSARALRRRRLQFSVNVPASAPGDPTTRAGYRRDKTVPSPSRDLSLSATYPENSRRGRARGAPRTDFQPVSRTTARAKGQSQVRAHSTTPHERFAVVWPRRVVWRAQAPFTGADTAPSRASSLGLGLVRPLSSHLASNPTRSSPAVTVSVRRSREARVTYSLLASLRPTPPPQRRTRRGSEKPAGKANPDRRRRAGATGGTLVLSQELARTPRPDSSLSEPASAQAVRAHGPGLVPYKLAGFVRGVGPRQQSERTARPDACTHSGLGSSARGFDRGRVGRRLARGRAGTRLPAGEPAGEATRSAKRGPSPRGGSQTDKARKARAHEGPVPGGCSPSVAPCLLFLSCAVSERRAARSQNSRGIPRRAGSAMGHGRGDGLQCCVGCTNEPFAMRSVVVDKRRRRRRRHTQRTSADPHYVRPQGLTVRRWLRCPPRSVTAEPTQTASIQRPSIPERGTSLRPFPFTAPPRDNLERDMTSLFAFQRYGPAPATCARIFCAARRRCPAFSAVRSAHLAPTIARWLFAHLRPRLCPLLLLPPPPPPPPSPTREAERGPSPALARCRGPAEGRGAWRLRGHFSPQLRREQAPLSCPGVFATSSERPAGLGDAVRARGAGHRRGSLKPMTDVAHSNATSARTHAAQASGSRVDVGPRRACAPPPHRQMHPRRRRNAPMATDDDDIRGQATPLRSRSSGVPPGRQTKDECRTNGFAWEGRRARTERGSAFSIAVGIHGAKHAKEKDEFEREGAWGGGGIDGRSHGSRGARRASGSAGGSRAFAHERRNDRLQGAAVLARALLLNQAAIAATPRSGSRRERAHRARAPFSNARVLGGWQSGCVDRARARGLFDARPLDDRTVRWAPLRPQRRGPSGAVSRNHASQGTHPHHFGRPPRPAAAAAAAEHRTRGSGPTPNRGRARVARGYGSHRRSGRRRIDCPALKEKRGGGRQKDEKEGMLVGGHGDPPRRPGCPVARRSSGGRMEHAVRARGTAYRRVETTCFRSRQSYSIDPTCAVTPGAWAIKSLNAIPVTIGPLLRFDSAAARSYTGLGLDLRACLEIDSMRRRSPLLRPRHANSDLQGPSKTERGPCTSIRPRLRHPLAASGSALTTRIERSRVGTHEAGPSRARAQRPDLDPHRVSRARVPPRARAGRRRGRGTRGAPCCFCRPEAPAAEIRGRESERGAGRGAHGRQRDWPGPQRARRRPGPCLQLCSAFAGFSSAVIMIRTCERAPAFASGLGPMACGLAMHACGLGSRDCGVRPLSRPVSAGVARRVLRRDTRPKTRPTSLHLERRRRGLTPGRRRRTASASAACHPQPGEPHVRARHTNTETSTADCSPTRPTRVGSAGPPSTYGALRLEEPPRPTVSCRDPSRRKLRSRAPPTRNTRRAGLARASHVRPRADRLLEVRTFRAPSGLYWSVRHTLRRDRKDGRGGGPPPDTMPAGRTQRRLWATASHKTSGGSARRRPTEAQGGTVSIRVCVTRHDGPGRPSFPSLLLPRSQQWAPRAAHAHALRHGEGYFRRARGGRAENSAGRGRRVREKARREGTEQNRRGASRGPVPVPPPTASAAQWPLEIWGSLEERSAKAGPGVLKLGGPWGLRPDVRLRPQVRGTAETDPGGLTKVGKEGAVRRPARGRTRTPPGEAGAPGLLPMPWRGTSSTKVRAPGDGVRRGSFELRARCPGEKVSGPVSVSPGRGRVSTLERERLAGERCVATPRRWAARALVLAGGRSACDAIAERGTGYPES